MAFKVLIDINKNSAMRNTSSFVLKYYFRMNVSCLYKRKFKKNVKDNNSVSNGK